MKRMSFCWFMLFVLISFSTTTAQDVDDEFGFKGWPGKDGAIKNDITLPIEPFLGYGIRLHENHEKAGRFSHVFMRIPHANPGI
ncbi:MAG TPA: hypothetical protein ENH82_17255, partial [bacterium]|nr:hypothetical protein [bacterium]